MTHDTRATALSALLLRLVMKAEPIWIRRDVALAVREFVSLSASRYGMIQHCKRIVHLHRANHPCAK